MEQKILLLIANVLGLDETSLHSETSASEVLAWDSLRHINLVLALEQEFQVTFTDDEIVTMVTVPGILNALASHGV